MRRKYAMRLALFLAIIVATVLPTATVLADDAGIVQIFTALVDSDAGDFSGLMSGKGSTGYIGFSTFSGPGTLSNLTIKLSAAPGAGKSRTYTVVKNGIATSLAVTISGAVDTTGSDDAHTVSVVAGDYVYYLPAVAGGPAAATCSASIKLTNTNAGESHMPTGSNGQVVTAADRYFALWNGWNASQTAGTVAQQSVSIASIPGTLTGLFVTLVGAGPGAGTNYSFHIYKNNIDQGEAFQIANAATTGSAILNIAVVAGDQLTLYVTPTNAPQNRFLHWGTTFVPTDTTLAVIPGAQAAQPVNNQYVTIEGGAGSATGTESAAQSVSHAMTIANLFVALSTAPGVGTSWTYTIMKNGVPTLLTATVGDAATTGSDTTNSVTVAEGDLLDVKMTSTGAPGALFGTFSTSQRSHIPPTVTTQAVSGIATTTATGNGNVTDDGGTSITERGVVWGLALNPTTADSKSAVAGTTGAFTAPITGLTTGTLYHVRAYAANAIGTSYGTDVTFTSLKLATVTGQAVTVIDTTTATGNGNITDLGVPNPTDHGVVWNTTGAPTTADNKTAQGAVGAIGAFTSSLTSLTPNTTYYVRAYATNSAGTAYSNQVNFTTLDNTPVGTLLLQSLLLLLLAIGILLTTIRASNGNWISLLVLLLIGLIGFAVISSIVLGLL